LGCWPDTSVIEDAVDPLDEPELELELELELEPPAPVEVKPTVESPPPDVLVEVVVVLELAAEVESPDDPTVIDVVQATTPNAVLAMDTRAEILMAGRGRCISELPSTPGRRADLRRGYAALRCFASGKRSCGAFPAARRAILDAARRWTRPLRCLTSSLGEGRFVPSSLLAAGASSVSAAEPS
jgi:hypothetical protein